MGFCQPASRKRAPVEEARPMSTVRLEAVKNDTSKEAAQGIAMQPASYDIWDKKYRLKSKQGDPVDASIDHTYQRVAKALAERKGIRRYGSCDLAMDEALSRCAIDVSGRSFLVFKVNFPTAKIGTFDTELVREWFQAFAMNAGITLHIESAYGANSHHIAESCFKALARALRDALEIDPRQKDRIPSTKGTLG